MGCTPLIGTDYSYVGEVVQVGGNYVVYFIIGGRFDMCGVGVPRTPYSANFATWKADDPSSLVGRIPPPTTVSWHCLWIFEEKAAILF